MVECGLNELRVQVGCKLRTGWLSADRLSSGWVHGRDGGRAVPGME